MLYYSYTLIFSLFHSIVAMWLCVVLFAPWWRLSVRKWKDYLLTYFLCHLIIVLSCRERPVDLSRLVDTAEVRVHQLWSCSSQADQRTGARCQCGAISLLIPSCRTVGLPRRVGDGITEVRRLSQRHGSVLSEEDSLAAGRHLDKVDGASFIYF